MPLVYLCSGVGKFCKKLNWAKFYAGIPLHWETNSAFRINQVFISLVGIYVSMNVHTDGWLVTGEDEVLQN